MWLSVCTRPSSCSWKSIKNSISNVSELKQIPKCHVLPISLGSITWIHNATVGVLTFPAASVEPQPISDLDWAQIGALGIKAKTDGTAEWSPLWGGRGHCYRWCSIEDNNEREKKKINLALTGTAGRVCLLKGRANICDSDHITRAEPGF